MADIKLIKFSSGEEIIATIISVGEGATVIKDGVTLVYHQTKEGTVSVGFSPFMPYHEGTVAVYHSAMAAITDVKQELLNEYNRIYGSGIVVAPAGSVPTGPIITK
jgi:hypothetical protein